MWTTVFDHGLPRLKALIIAGWRGKSSQDEFLVIQRLCVRPVVKMKSDIELESHTHRLVCLEAKSLC